MKQLSSWPARRTDRHATALLQDEPGCRVVGFTLAPQQAVPMHTSAATVMVTVVEGSGSFSGATGSQLLTAGESVVYAPQEPHGMAAGDDGLRFLAIITPNPSAMPHG